MKFTPKQIAAMFAAVDAALVEPKEFKQLPEVVRAGFAELGADDLEKLAHAVWCAGLENKRYAEVDGGYGLVKANPAPIEFNQLAGVAGAASEHLGVNIAKAREIAGAAAPLVLRALQMAEVIYVVRPSYLRNQRTSKHSLAALTWCAC